MIMACLYRGIKSLWCRHVNSLRSPLVWFLCVACSIVSLVLSAIEAMYRLLYLPSVSSYTVSQKDQSKTGLKVGSEIV